MTSTSKFIIFICVIALAFVIYDSINNSIENNIEFKKETNNDVNSDSMMNYINSIKDLETEKEKKKKKQEKDKRKMEVITAINERYSIPSYTILKQNLNNQIGFNVSVKIPEKYNNNELINIAKSVKEEVGTVSKNGKVFFYLPDMPDDNGAWAIVDFNLEIEVKILGKSLTDENIIRKSINNIKDYYGLWYDNFSSGVSVFRIRKDKRKGYVYEYIDPDYPEQNENSWMLKKGMKNGKVVFYDLEHVEDKVYFEIEKNGDLTQYDKSRFISTYKKLK